MATQMLDSGYGRVYLWGWGVTLFNRERVGLIRRKHIRYSYGNLIQSQIRGVFEYMDIGQAIKISLLNI